MTTQVNGGTTAQKVEFAKSLLEKDVTVDSVFSKDENIDTIGATKVGLWVGCGRGRPCFVWPCTHQPCRSGPPNPS